MTDIQTWIESYWPISIELRRIENRVNASQELSEKEQEAEFIAAYEEYHNYLENKYGADVFKRWLALGSRHIKKMTDASYDEVNSYTFSSNLIVEAPADTVLRSRTTLQSILEILAARKEFTLLDAGCGEGRIAAGIALYNPEAKVTALDKNAEALSFLARFVRSRSPQEQQILKKNLLMDRADYRTPKKMPAYDVVLAAYPYENPERITHYCLPFLKDDGSLFLYYPLTERGPNNFFEIMSYLEDTMGVTTHLADRRAYFCNDEIIECEIKRR